jgi:autotransporter passenger strand-loop-strand repeat protein
MTYYINSGQTSSGITVDASNGAIVSNGGMVISATVTSGGTLSVNSGGTASGTTLNSGGVENVSGTEVSGTVNNGGTLDVVGTASGVTVSSGGIESIFGGTDNGGFISGGGTILGLVMSSGTVNASTSSFNIDTVTIDSGAIVGLTVLSGASVSGMTINSGGNVVVSGGTASNLIVNKGGTAIVNGGTADGTVVNSGATETVWSGTTSGTTVNNGGIEYVYSGGTVSGSQVNSGGNEYVSGGTAISTIVSAGGAETVYVSGTTSGTLLNSGGIENVLSGGNAIATTVNSGGEIIIATGATVSGPTVNIGAKLDIEQISATSASLSGSSLVLTSGGVTVDTIGLAGATSGLAFTTSSDGSGGTLVTVIDGTLPAFVGAAVNGNSLAMSYTDDVNLSATAPAAGDFTVMDGSTQVNVTGVTVNAANKTVTLMLGGAVQYGDTVTVAYTQGSDANPIQGVNGNKAADLAAQGVANNTADNTSNTPSPPVVSSAIVADNTKVSEPSSAQVVAVSQNTLQDSGDAAYTSALQKAADVVIAMATAPSLSNFNSTAASLSNFASGSYAVLPHVSNVTVASNTDLSSLPFISGLLESGDTNLTIQLNGSSNGSSSYNVLPSFTQTYTGGATGNDYVVGNQSSLGVLSPLDRQNSNGFQQIYAVQIEGFSSGYTLSSYYGTAILTSKSSGQVITVNIPQPAPGANNSGVDVQFLDGSLSITGNTDPNTGLWTAWVTQGDAPGSNPGLWSNSNAIWLVPSIWNVQAVNSAQPLDLGSAQVQNNLLNTVDNSQSAGFYGGISLGLLPSTIISINNTTPNATLTGILGAGVNNPATFLSGDSITLSGGNTTLNLFDFTGGTPLPANTLVSGVNTLNLASNAGIGTVSQADDFSGWSGLTLIDAIASGTGAGATDNGLINLIVGNSAVVNLIANVNYITAANGVNSRAGAIMLSGGTKITITQNLGTADGSPFSSGGITVNGGSATSSATVTQSAAVSGSLTDGAVIINDISANSSTLAGSLSAVILNNYGQGSVINDNAIRLLTLSGTGGTLTLNDSNTRISTTNNAVTVPANILYLTLTGLSAAGDNTITDLNSEITSLNIITTGTVVSTLNGFVDNHLTSISVQGTSALTLLNPSASLTSYSIIGSNASLTVAGHSDAAEAKLTLSGAVTYTGTSDAVSSGITLAAGSDNSNISFSTTGALSSNNSNTFTLGNGNNTLSDIVLNAAGTTTITTGSGSNQISTGSNIVNITLGSHAAGAIDSVGVGASSNGGLSIITTITGMQSGDSINIADATQFNSAGINASIVTASGGDATLAGWVNAALSGQGANLQAHAETWFNFGGNTYLIEQANSQGSAFAEGDTLVKLVGTLNESAATLNGHTVTL